MGRASMATTPMKSRAQLARREWREWGLGLLEHKGGGHPKSLEESRYGGRETLDAYLVQALFKYSKAISRTYRHHHLALAVFGASFPRLSLSSLSPFVCLVPFFMFCIFLAGLACIYPFCNSPIFLFCPLSFFICFWGTYPRMYNL